MIGLGDEERRGEVGANDHGRPGGPGAAWARRNRLAHLADWCFVLARTEAGSRRSAGLSYLLVPMDQPGITVRPIR